MNTIFFNTEERIDQLEAVCRSIVGKRFSKFYECKDFVIEILEGMNVDLCALKDMPRVSMDHAKFHSNSPLLDLLLEHPECRKHLKVIEASAPWMPGDLIPIKTGKTQHHIAIKGKENIYHLPRYGKVCFHSEEFFRTNCNFKNQIIFRLKEGVPVL